MEWCAEVNTVHSLQPRSRNRQVFWVGPYEIFGPQPSTTSDIRQSEVIQNANGGQNDFHSFGESGKVSLRKQLLSQS